MTLQTDLIAVLTSADQKQADTQAALDAANLTASSLQTSLNTANSKTSSLQTSLNTANAQIVSLQAQIVSLQDQIASTQNPVVQPSTQYGACPNKAGQDAVVKWGTGTVDRIFNGAIATVNRPTGASRVHVSFSLVSGNRDAALNNLAAGANDAAITAMAKALNDGDVVEIIHEGDKKISDGVATWGPLLAGKNRFYDVVKAANPKVLVANTVTGWLTDPKSGKDVSIWGQIKADIFGIDCDGVNPTSLPYPNYDDEIATAVAFIKTYASNGYKYFAVPEFCATRMSVDADSVERVKWMNSYAAKFKANGALYVCWYDYDMSVGNELTLTNEVNAWKALVATH